MKQNRALTQPPFCKAGKTKGGTIEMTDICSGAIVWETLWFWGLVLISRLQTAIESSVFSSKALDNVRQVRFAKQFYSSFFPSLILRNRCFCFPFTHERVTGYTVTCSWNLGLLSHRISFKNLALECSDRKPRCGGASDSNSCIHSFVGVFCWRAERFTSLEIIWNCWSMKYEFALPG